jgi:hypothetical protein
LRLLFMGGLILTGIGVVVTVPGVFTIISQRRLEAEVRAGREQTVVGTVEHFQPEPVGGHQDESFEVAGREFHYSSFDFSAGFNTTQPKGGPIHEGQTVRVTFVNGDIVKLEIAR